MKAWECLVKSEIIILHLVEKWHTKKSFFGKLKSRKLFHSYLKSLTLLHTMRCTKHCKVCLSFAPRLAIVLVIKLTTSILETTASFKIKILQKVAQYLENKTFI